MNIILKIADVIDVPLLKKLNIASIYFLDTRKNIIMDGDFTKILFVKPHFTMDGIFIDFPVTLMNNYTEKNSNKSIIWYQPYHQNNILIFQYLMEIEKQLIDYYIKYKGIDKKPQYSLYSQLQSGSAKIYSSYKMKQNDSTSSLNSQNTDHYATETRKNLNQRIIKSGTSRVTDDLTSSASITDKEMNTTTEGQYQMLSGLHEKRLNGQAITILSRSNSANFLQTDKDFADSEPEKAQKQYYIKMSGIWESHDSVGLTYKILQKTW